ncbi:hypothetical protein CBR_g17764 [Chara braunii]|uniref:Reverse transcriptase domain-containing protein n=1 Tax=Chara braunii TaxID=69332 RepID=A0A388KVF6_CHABU|nr:hypothetical protein CBR_g17764 [Chara braunii]|eukprot:GBG74054.1 hypothetical protein CBR_g17764 [Chara braunii]
MQDDDSLLTWQFKPKWNCIALWVVPRRRPLIINAREVAGEKFVVGGSIMSASKPSEVHAVLKFMDEMSTMEALHAISRWKATRRDVPKTAFRSQFGHYEFTVMSFGLTNAPATFQRAMSDIFRDTLEQYVLVYLDDILVYSRTLEEHLRHLRGVLDRLRRHGFYAKLSKCRFAQHKVDFLGHYVSDQGLHMDDVKITAIAEWPAPTSAKQLRSFLGLTSYYTLEMDVDFLKDDVQLQQTTAQQLEQRICTAANTSSPEPRETATKFDGWKIFCDSIKTNPIPWFCKFELTLQLHNVKEHKHHAYLYSRSGGECQAWLDNLLSKYGVVAANLHTKISWDDLKAAWHKRFQVESPEIKAMDKLMVFEQGALPSTDWITEYQRLTSVPDIQMGFKAIHHYFISRSCPTLSNALTHVEDTLTTTEELFDKATQIIITNKEAKNLRSSVAGPRRDQHRPRVAVVVAATPFDQTSEAVSAHEGDRLAAAREAPFTDPVNGERGYGTVYDCVSTTASSTRKPSRMRGLSPASIRSNDRYKSAFKMQYGHFEWVVMPFGLTNAPMTFQATMTNEFRAMLDRFVLVYVDDILVYSRTLEDHLGHLRRVLETLCRAKYKANRDKCEFVRQELKYLGHFVTQEGISPLSDKIQAIQEWPEPRNVMDVRSFLGLAGYYQRFIKGYSKISAHLTKLQCEDWPFDFGEEAR